VYKGEKTYNFKIKFGMCKRFITKCIALVLVSFMPCSLISKCNCHINHK